MIFRPQSQHSQLIYCAENISTGVVLSVMVLTSIFQSGFIHLVHKIRFYSSLFRGEGIKVPIHRPQRRYLCLLINAFGFATGVLSNECRFGCSNFLECDDYGRSIVGRYSTGEPPSEVAFYFNNLAH